MMVSGRVEDEAKERTSRTNREDEERLLASNSMRGRFGSPVFGLEHFQARPVRPLQTRPPPRIELSVQISILTANLPANSPLLHVLLFTLHRQSPSRFRFFLVLQMLPCRFRLEL